MFSFNQGYAVLAGLILALLKFIKTQIIKCAVCLHEPQSIICAGQNPFHNTTTAALQNESLLPDSTTQSNTYTVC